MWIFRLFTWPKFLMRIVMATLILPGVVLWLLYSISKDCFEHAIVFRGFNLLSFAFKRLRQAVIMMGYFLVGGIKTLPMAEKE